MQSWKLLAWAGGLVASARMRVFGLVAGIVLAAFPLFFAWRSLTKSFRSGAIAHDRCGAGGLPAQASSAHVDHGVADRPGPMITSMQGTGRRAGSGGSAGKITTTIGGVAGGDGAA